MRSKPDDFAANLNSDKFMRVHRSHVINVEAIDSFGVGFVVVNGIEVPLGSAYKDELRQWVGMF